MRSDKMDEEMVRSFLGKNNVFAVVGASRDPKSMITKFMKT